MSHHRHADEARATPANTPPELLARIEALRARATRRKLLLLECAIVRHAPFADCGRPLWELMAEQPWFVGERPSYADRPGESITGHDAVECVEQNADSVAANDLREAERYFYYAEFAAYCDVMELPTARRAELRVRYGAAGWLKDVRRHGDLRNVLDYYLAGDFTAFYHMGAWHRLHPGHRPAALALIDDLFGPEPPRFDPAWRTSDAVGLAAAMYDARDFGVTPILADALEEAGCDNLDLLAHCRAGGRHVRGCWAVDVVLGKFH